MQDKLDLAKWGKPDFEPPKRIYIGLPTATANGGKAGRGAIGEAGAGHGSSSRSRNLQDLEDVVDGTDQVEMDHRSPSLGLCVERVGGKV